MQRTEDHTVIVYVS